MNVIIQAKSLQVTDALDSHITKQAQKLEKVTDRITKVNVFLEQLDKKTNDPHRAQVRYKVEMPGKDIVVEHQSHDMYEAVTQATRSVVRDVRKLKEKKISKTRQRKYNYKTM